MKRNKPALKDIMRVTGLSRATIDRVLNGRSGVHPETQSLVEMAVQKLSRGDASISLTARPAKLKNFRLVIQADDEFMQAVTEENSRLAPEMAEKGWTLEILRCSDMVEDEHIALMISEQEAIDGIAIHAKNVFPVIRAATDLRHHGLPVVAMNTDLDIAARDAFVGIDNRAAGQTAGFLMGRHLCLKDHANVAVVVQTLAFRDHEEREMGFRSVLRQRFPSVKLIDVVALDNSSRSAYESIRDLLAHWPEIDGIYNTAGGNSGLAQALVESGRQGRTLFVAHEFHAVTEPLIRSDAIDYLITQNLRSLLIGVTSQLYRISTGDSFQASTLITPELLCKYCLPS